jgi:hypothetical protein
MRVTQITMVAVDKLVCPCLVDHMLVCGSVDNKIESADRMQPGSGEHGEQFLASDADQESSNDGRLRVKLWPLSVDEETHYEAR